MAETRARWRLMAERARALMLEAFTQLGMPADQAAICADCFLFASLRGVDSHGIIHLFPMLCRNLKSGVVRADAVVTVQQETAAVARLDGCAAAGPVIGARGMDLAIAKARELGVGVVVAANCNHFGAASFYCVRAAEAGLFGMTMCDAYPNVVPFGGRAALHGTNPIAYAVPAPGRPPIVFDVATSVAAFGQVTKAKRRGEPIPAGWALDERGDATTDPVAARALLPFGGHKGYGLGLLVDVLCAALTGSPIALEHQEARLDSQPMRQSFFFLALDPVKFGAAAFADRVARLVADATSIPPAAGFDEVLLPGDLEARTFAERSRTGIPLYEEDWAAMQEGLAAAGLDTAELARRFGPEEA